MGLEALREALRDKVTDTFENGTVFRWTSGGKYQYAAIKVAGNYYLTGQYDYYRVGTSATYEEMLDIFARSDTTDIKVATGWETV